MKTARQLLLLAAFTASACLAQAAGAPPFNLAATPATTSSATLTWRTPADPADIDYYIIYRNGTQLSDHPTQNTVNLAVPVGGSYTFTVAAHYRSSGIGSQSSAVNARPLQASRSPTILYADATLPADITDGTYSLAARSGGGSDGNAYNTVQAAVFNMQPGDTLYLRGGTFHEMNIYIGKLASGRADAWYTIASYPGEWAIVDGQHNLGIAHTDTYNGSIFRGTTAGGMQGYIKFERIEITGAGRDLTDPQYPSAGCGITMRGGPLAFRHLYIHNNYGDSSNNNAGLRFEGATGDTLVEYCRFKANGQIGMAEPTTSVANLMIFADYSSEEKTVTRYHATTGYCTATMNNEVRYNLFEADSGLSSTGAPLYTATGFKHKGMQRQTGYLAVDSGYSGDLAPNGSSLDDTGDRIHHNIFLDHPIAVEVDQDYTQVHNNIIWSKNWGNFSGNAIQGRDGNSGRRGPHDFVVYNNTIFGNGVTSINHHPVPQGWPGSDWPADLPQDVPYAECWFLNNLLDNPGEKAWHIGKITVQSDSVTCTGYPLADIHLGRNYFYNTSADDLFYIHQTYYDKAGIEATPCADKVFWQARDAADHAFAADYSASPTLAAKYLTRGSHVIEGAYTIANAGIGGAHPYLSGVTFPTYIGATNPNDNAWVAGVLGLGNVANLREGGAGNAPWIEGSGTHILWRDDFDDGQTLASKYEDISTNGMSVSPLDSRTGESSLAQAYATGQVGAGWVIKYRPSGFPDRVFMRWYHKFEAGFQGFPPKMARIRARNHSTWTSSLAVHCWIETDGAVALDVAADDSTQANAEGWLPIARSSFSFANPANIDRWVCFEMEVQLNTPGSANGAYRLWIDDTLAVERTGVDLRGSQTYSLNECMLDCYWNGGSPRPQRRFYDSFVIATAKIGPEPALATFTTWRAANWVGSDLANDAISGPLADPDGCGLNNLARYAFALPARGPVANPTTPGTTTSAGASYLTLTFPRRAAADDLTYTLEASTDLVTWTAVPGRTYTAGSGPITAQDAVALGSTPRRFLRLRITKP